MKRKIIPRQEFVTYASFPLVAGDVRAYEIQLDLGEDISGAEFKITAIRSDGTVVEDIGSVSGGIASYTVAGSMYSVPGELTVRLSVIHNSSVLTDREIIFEVLENVSGTDTAYTTVNINDSVILRISALEDKLSGKVDRISGKGLSSNDFTDEYKAVLEGLDDNISQKLGSLDEHIGNVSNPHKVTAVQVGAYTKAEVDEKCAAIEEAAETRVSEATDNLSGSLDKHIGNVSNPHKVTAVQVGAYTKAEVDEKCAAIEEAAETRVSEATDNLSGSLDEHIGNVSNPHKVTAVQVGAYTKEDIDAQILEINYSISRKAEKWEVSNVYKYRGSVAEKDLLPFEYKFTVNGAPYVYGEGGEIGTYDEETGIITIDYSATVDKYKYIVLPVEPVTIKKGWYGYFSMNQSEILVEYNDLTLYMGIDEGANGVVDGATMMEEVTEDIVIDKIFCFFENYCGENGNTLSITGSGTLEISLIKTSYDGSLEYPPDKGDAENLSIGDVYNIFDTDENFAWTGTEWDALGGNHIDSEARADIENIENRFDLTSEELGVVGTKASANEENIAALRADIENIENQLGLTIEELGVVGSKLSENTYSKDEVDEKCAVIEEAVETRVSEATDNLSGSLDEHIGSINNPHKVTAVQVGAYTKAEVDELLSQKADTEVYTKNVFANALKGSANGEIISLTDASPIEHTMAVKLSSDTITDFSTVTLSRYGKNLLPNKFTVELPYTTNGITFADNGDGGIRVSGTATSTASINYSGVSLSPNVTYRLVHIGGVSSLNTFISYYDENNTSQLYATKSGANFTWKNTYTFRRCFLQVDSEQTVDVVVYPMLVLSTSDRTEYEPYIEPVTYTPNADGTVEGVKSIYPNTTLMTDTSGVLIDCEYNKDVNKVIETLTNAIISLGGNV